MPISKMKKVWDYCTYNKPFFLLVLILFLISEFILGKYDEINTIEVFIIISVVSVVLYGYGMTIARDRMNNGIRLPKIMIKDIVLLGTKSYIVFTIYLIVQGFILDLISSPLAFPEFNLEEMLIELPETFHQLFSHNPVDTLVFVIVGSVLFYITTFFMEIALARLADSGSMISAFNLVGIKRDIDTVGWWDYAKEYTSIVFAIVLFAALKYIVIPNYFLDLIWDVLLNLFMFVTQFLGIGIIYSVVKAKKSNSDLKE